MVGQTEREQHLVERPAERQDDHPAEVAHQHADQERRDHAGVEHHVPAVADARQMQRDRIGQDEAEHGDRRPDRERAAERRQIEWIAQRLGVVRERQRVAVGRATVPARAETHGDHRAIRQHQEDEEQQQDRGAERRELPARRRHAAAAAIRAAPAASPCVPVMSQACAASTAIVNAVPAITGWLAGSCITSAWPSAVATSQRWPAPTNTADVSRTGSPCPGVAASDRLSGRMSRLKTAPAARLGGPDAARSEPATVTR